jgi:hypothetical protein
MSSKLLKLILDMTALGIMFLFAVGMIGALLYVFVYQIPWGGGVIAFISVISWAALRVDKIMSGLD